MKNDLAPINLAPYFRIFLSTKQAAKIVGYSEGWLMHLRRQGEGPKHVKAPLVVKGKVTKRTVIRYKIDDLIRWIEAHKIKTLKKQIDYSFAIIQKEIAKYRFK